MPIRVTRQPTAEAIGSMALQIGRGRAAQTAADRAEMIRQFEETLGEQKREFDVGTKMRMAEASLDFRMFERQMDEAATARREGYGFAREQQERGIAASAEDRERQISATLQANERAYEQAIRLKTMGNEEARDVADQLFERQKVLARDAFNANLDLLRERLSEAARQGDQNAFNSLLGQVPGLVSRAQGVEAAFGRQFSQTQITDAMKEVNSKIAQAKSGIVRPSEMLGGVIDMLGRFGGMQGAEMIQKPFGERMAGRNAIFEPFGPGNGMLIDVPDGRPMWIQAPKTSSTEILPKDQLDLTLQWVKGRADTIAAVMKTLESESAEGAKTYRSRAEAIQIADAVWGSTPPGSWEGGAPPAPEPGFDLGQWLGGVLGMGGEGQAQAPAAPTATPSPEQLQQFREIANTPGHPHRATAQAIIARWSQ